MTIASVVIILRLRPQQAPATETDAALPAAPIRLEPLPLTDEKLDDSRYL
jgi:hypothetical protein